MDLTMLGNCVYSKRFINSTICTDAAAAIYELLVANANIMDLTKRSLVSGWMILI